MACKYPDIGDYQELWQNVLSQRRSFRKLPENRLSADYFSKDDQDKVYSRIAAVIDGYHFDRAKYGISGKNFRSADLTHWLALDMATQALEDAGLAGSPKIPKDKTGVFVGNTLTGEFSRSNVMRLRWPFVSKKVRTQLLKKEWPEAEIFSFLEDMEADYKSSFPPMYEDSLAGGLANTIAGRICNYHDFHGGGYTVDGACSSSLLAVIEACKSLESGDHLVSLAGGVDLSLDPFELVGFSRAGALAKKDMLVYDRNSNGFWPGEGCGFVVLANLDFAVANHLPVHALIKGYGISSDGQGGLTRPAVSGQTMAMEKAYAHAGYPVNQVTYFEGHGTGTEVGDQVELQTVIAQLNKDRSDDKKHYIGTIKGNIGHTKAAAGIAGLLKIVNVVKNRVVPAITGCQDKHSLLLNAPLDVSFRNIAFKDAEPMRASVSAMGFGGINTHITIEEYGFKPESQSVQSLAEPVAVAWESGLFLFSADSREEMLRQLSDLSVYAALISYGELADLSASLYRAVGNGKYRAGIVAASPSELTLKLDKLSAAIHDQHDFVNHKEVFFYGGLVKSRIGFLFPGQGSKSFSLKGKLSVQFPWIRVPDHFPVLSSASVELQVTQPAIVGTTMIAVAMLKMLGITAQLGLGHSLGEIAALGWAGVLKEEDALYLALKRGEVMAEADGLEGLMLIVSASEEKVSEMTAGIAVEIAAVNSEKQTVVSGRADEVVRFRSLLSSAGVPSTLLPVKYAFHSSYMKKVENAFSSILDGLDFSAPARKIISSVSGKEVFELPEIQENLIRQLSSPVQFLKAIKTAEEQVDFWIELGGDKTLMNIVKNSSDKPISCMSLDGDTSSGLLSTVGLTWVLGNNVDLDFLFKGLPAKNFSLNWSASFFSNPCEVEILPELTASGLEMSNAAAGNFEAEGSLMTAFKTMIANKLEFALEDIDVNFRFLDDFHLNSLEVGQLIAAFASANHIVMKSPATEYANASIREIVGILEMNASDVQEQGCSVIPGIAPWVHFFGISEQENQLDKRMLPAAKKADDNWYLMQKEALQGGYSPEEMEELSGHGLIINFQDCNEAEVINLLGLFIEKVKSEATLTHVIVLQPDFIVGGFMKSIFLESKHLNFLLLTSKERISVSLLKEEQNGNTGFKEVTYRHQTRFTPLFQPLFRLEREGQVGLSETDVILVTGGAKGITAECALALGRKYTSKLLLLGRSDPKLDKNLENNLKRFEAAGITYRYYKIDISDKEEVAGLIRSVVNEFGKITGFIHGAGMNRPLSWRQMGVSEINESCGAKLLGFRNVTDALNPDELKMLIGFGSIIAESGMNGNADYALVNEWLRNDIGRFSKQNPDCKCLNVEWSVWSGAGMGEHLGVLEQLIRSGIQPIHLDKGTALFLDWMADFPASGNVIVSGRYGSKSTLKEPEVPIPLLRYLEDVRLFYPGLEIISEFELSEHNDLYLKDHQLSGEFVFPAVMGLEAMQQVAAVLIPPGQGYAFHQGRFSYPIVLGRGSTVKVRVVATRISAEQVKVVLRCSATDFCQDHFEAILMPEDGKGRAKKYVSEDLSPPNLQVATELYDNLLFHEGIFKVIHHYDHLSPYHCIANGRRTKNIRYFSDFISSEILSFEPTIRDAALHCVQACVPEFRLLPVGFKKIHSFYPDLKDALQFSMEAVEILKEDKLYVYNLYIRTESGELIEYWEEVQFKVLSDQKVLALPLDLLGIVIKRKVDELFGSRIDFKMSTSGLELTPLMKRYDGKPYVAGGHVSKTHMEQLSLQVISPFQVGCDLEKVGFQTDQHWLALLGEERYQLANYVSRVCKEQLSVSATRIWGIAEGIKKADLHLLGTILLDCQDSPYLHYYKCENNTIISFAFWSKEVDAEAVFTLVLVDEHNPVKNEKV